MLLDLLLSAAPDQALDCTQLFVDLFVPRVCELGLLALSQA